MKATTDGKNSRSQSSNRYLGSGVDRWILQAGLCSHLNHDAHAIGGLRKTSKQEEQQP